MHSLNVDIRPAFQWVGPTAGLYAADCLLLWQQLFCRCQISPAHRQMEQKPHQPELLKTPASIIVWSKKCRIQIKNCDTHAFSQRLNLLALGGRQADWVEGRERLCHRQIRHACTYNPSAINPAASLSATQPKLIYALVTLKWALPRSHQNIITFYSLLWRHGSQGDRTQYICKHVRTVPVCSLQLLQGFLSFHSFALCLRYNLVLKRHFLLQQPAQSASWIRHTQVCQSSMQTCKQRANRSRPGNCEFFQSVLAGGTAGQKQAKTGFNSILIPLTSSSYSPPVIVFDLICLERTGPRAPYLNPPSLRHHFYSCQSHIKSSPLFPEGWNRRSYWSQGYCFSFLKVYTHMIKW